MNRIIQKLFMPSGIGGTGAALFVSLVFLLILTIIGLAGMQNSSLQEKMAGHLRDRNLAFQSAESALRAGEEYLANNNFPEPVCDGENDGWYNNSTLVSTSDCPTSKGWPSNRQSDHPSSPENENFWKGNTDVVTLGKDNHTFDKLADKPKYVIEALSRGAQRPQGTTLEANIPVSLLDRKYYRIIARGVGMTDSTVVITQSVVRQ